MSIEKMGKTIIANALTTEIKVKNLIPVDTGRLNKATRFEWKGDTLIGVSDPVGVKGTEYASYPYKISKKNEWFVKFAQRGDMERTVQKAFDVLVNQTLNKKK
jgi:hypothetical protein